MFYSGCLSFFTFIIFLKVLNPIISNQTVDSIIVEEISDWLIQRAKEFNQHAVKSFKIQTEHPEFTQLIEEQFITQNTNLVENSDSLTIVFQISTKGEIIRNNQSIDLDGVALIKLIQNNQIIESKRIVIKKKHEIIDNLESLFWVIKKPEKKSGLIQKWIEPSLIISSMVLSVYLLFTVRS
jgi:hypothetical protein